MSDETLSTEALEKQLRVLRKKLERSERNRADMEDQRDRDQSLHRKLHDEVEVARREAEIQAALERVRAQAMAMRASDELLDVIFKIHQEFSGLGLPCGTFWHTRYTPDNYHKALTGIGGEKLAAIMELPRDFTSNPALAEWERGDEKIGVFKFDADAACRYLHHMVTRGKFLEVDPEAITEEMVRENNGWTFVQARTSHGEIGYTLWGETEPSQEAKDVLMRFANAFDLAYRRFQDLQQAEGQKREAQIQLALERIRTQSLRMQHSTELVATSAVFHEQVLVLGVATEFSYVWLPDEAATKHQFWATWTSEEDGECVHHSRAITYDLDKSEPYTAACFAAWESDDPIHVERIAAEDVEHFFTTWEELLRGAEHLRPERFPDGIYYAEGYMQYGCFGINIRSKLTEEEEQIIQRFSVEFERAYTRFLDLQQAEAQAREAQIEAALERVRSRTMAMQSSDELAEVSLLLDQEVRGLGTETWGCAFNIYGPHDSTEWFGSEAGIDNPYKTPREKFFLRFYEKGQEGETFHLEEFAGDKCRQHYDYMKTLPVLGDMLRGVEASGNSLPSYQVDHVAYFEYGYLLFITLEHVPEAHAIFRRFARVFEQTYTRFLDLKQAEAQTREAQIEASLERIRARTMAMQESAELAEVIKVVFREALRLGFGAKACDLVILDEATGASTFWVSGELDIDKGEALHFRVPAIDHPHYVAGLTAWKNKEAVRHSVLEGDVCARYMQLLTASAEDSNAPEDVKDFIQGLRYIVHTEAYMRHGYFRVASLEPLGEEAADTLQRFARVFEQTYTRFLDLKQAEAQARESQIEAALERVRARAMAMHRSDELREVVAVVFEEMQRLGFPTGMCMIILYDEETGAAQFWVSGLTESVWPESYQVPYLDHPIYVDHFKAWQQGVSDLTVELSGEAKRSYDQLLFEETDFKKLAEATRTAMMELDNLWLTSSFMSSGIVQAVGPEPLQEDKAAILQRVAKVIDLTYTRVVDLQQAEEQAREAERQAALDRVRAEIASMRTADDLNRITPLIWTELTTLGVPFFRCGVFIMDEDEVRVHAYLSTPDGASLAALHLPYDTAESLRKTVEHWRMQMVYTDLWDRKQFADWVESIRAQGYAGASKQYQDGEEPPVSLALQFVPFTQGMLYVGSAEPLSSDQIDLVRALAEAFSVAYARYEDFTQLEVAKARVEEALADLTATQAQLIHSEKMASLGQMTAGIAHEIKNPLNFVSNFADLNVGLAEELSDEFAKIEAQVPGSVADHFKAALADVQSNAEHIAKHGRRADQIVKSMMQHARTSTGERVPTAINELVDEYVNLAFHGMRASTPDFSVEIERDYDESVGQVAVKGQELGRVLLNLLGNAFDAVDENGDKETSMRNGEERVHSPRVLVSTRRVGDAVEIRVADNGRGIPADLRDRIFEPFFTTKPTGSGTGLGLSISYDIITQAHGGTLRVESEEGEGATFVVTLPLE